MFNECDFERLVRLVREVTNEPVSRDGFSLSTKPGQKSRKEGTRNQWSVSHHSK